MENDIREIRKREKEKKGKEIRWTVMADGLKGYYPDAMTYADALKISQEIGGSVVDMISQEHLDKVMLNKNRQDKFNIFICKEFNEKRDYFINKINEMSQRKVDLINLPYKDLMSLIIETLGGNTASLTEYHQYLEDEDYEEYYVYVFSLASKPTMRQDLITVEFMFDHNDCTTEDENYYLSSCEGNPEEMFVYAKQLVDNFQIVA
jgi:hypothetical protein